jgi:HEAT repeat protein
MRDPDGETRLYCAWGLMQIADRSSLPQLRTAAGDRDEAVRTMAVFALGEMGDHDGAAALRSALRDPSMSVRWNAALSLARLGDDSGESVLIGVLEGKETVKVEQVNVSARLNAIRGLALLQGEVARAALRRAEAGGSDEVRATARLALESIAPDAPRALP